MDSIQTLIETYKQESITAFLSIPTEVIEKLLPPGNFTIMKTIGFELH